MVDYVLADTGPSCVNVGGIREASSSEETVVGNVKQLNGGKEVIYAKIGGTFTGTLTVGKTCYAPIQVANHGRNAVAVTASIGERIVIISLGATSAAENYYKNGTMLVECGAGTGYSYMIEGHPAFAASSTAAIVTLKDGIEVALTTASLVTLYANRAMNVVPNSSAAITGPAIGVLLISAAVSDYVYLGKRGEWPAKIEGTWIAGDDLKPGSADGTLAPWTTADTTSTIIGKARGTGSTTGFALCDFQL
jgi:hypothetical protein